MYRPVLEACRRAGGPPSTDAEPRLRAAGVADTLLRVGSGAAGVVVRSPHLPRFRGDIVLAKSGIARCCIGLASHLRRGCMYDPGFAANSDGNIATHHRVVGAPHLAHAAAADQLDQA